MKKLLSMFLCLMLFTCVCGSVFAINGESEVDGEVPLVPPLVPPGDDSEKQYAFDDDTQRVRIKDILSDLSIQCCSWAGGSYVLSIRDSYDNIADIVAIRKLIDKLSSLFENKFANNVIVNELVKDLQNLVKYYYTNFAGLKIDDYTIVTSDGHGTHYAPSGKQDRINKIKELFEGENGLINILNTIGILPIHH